MADSEDDDQCKLCGFHPPEGLRKHVYTARHNKTVKQRFLPFLKKLDEVRKELKKPTVVDGEIASAHFWCYPCSCRVDKHISDGESSIVNGGTLAHIASEDHAKSAKRFCQRHGVYQVEKDALSKLVLENELLVEYLGLVREATEKLQDEGARSEEAKHIADQEASRREAAAQQNPTGWHDGQRVWGGGIVKYQAGSDQYLAWPIDHHCQATAPAQGLSPFASARPLHGPMAIAEHGDGEIGVGAGITRLSMPVIKGVSGNVHTGAIPPWELPCETGSAPNESGQAPTIGPSAEEFRLHAYRQQVFTNSYPNRVGADHVKAMALQQTTQFSGSAMTSSTTAAESDPMWLPNFGRVYNHGARSDTKKEFFKEVRQSMARRKRKR